MRLPGRSGEWIAPIAFLRFGLGGPTPQVATDVVTSAVLGLTDVFADAYDLRERSDTAASGSWPWSAAARCSRSATGTAGRRKRDGCPRVFRTFVNPRPSESFGRIDTN